MKNKHRNPLNRCLLREHSCSDYLANYYVTRRRENKMSNKEIVYIAELDNDVDVH